MLEPGFAREIDETLPKPPRHPQNAGRTTWGEESMRHAALLPGLALALLVAAAHAQPAPDQAARVQAALDGWLADRAPVEKVTGIAAYVSFASPRPRHRGLRRPHRPRRRRPAGRPRHPLRHGQHVEVLRRRRHPQARGRGAPLPRRHRGQVAAPVPRLGRGEHPAPARHDERHPQLLRDRDDVARLGRGAGARLHRRGAGGARLSDRPRRPARHHRLPLFQHQLHPRRHDRRQGGGQALCGAGARS